MSLAGFAAQLTTRVETASTTRARAKTKERQTKRRKMPRWSTATVEVNIALEIVHPTKETGQVERARARATRKAMTRTRACSQL